MICMFNKINNRTIYKRWWWWFRVNSLFRLHLSLIFEIIINNATTRQDHAQQCKSQIEYSHKNKRPIGSNSIEQDASRRGKHHLAQIPTCNSKSIYNAPNLLISIPQQNNIHCYILKHSAQYQQYRNRIRIESSWTLYEAKHGDRKCSCQKRCWQNAPRVRRISQFAHYGHK